MNLLRIYLRKHYSATRDFEENEHKLFIFLVFWEHLHIFSKLERNSIFVLHFVRLHQ